MVTRHLCLDAVATIALLLNCVVTVFSLLASVILCLIFSEFCNVCETQADVVLNAAAVTALVFLSLTVYTLVSKHDFSWMVCRYVDVVVASAVVVLKFTLTAGLNCLH